MSESMTKDECVFVPPHEPWTCSVHPGGYRTSLDETVCRATLDVDDPFCKGGKWYCRTVELTSLLVDATRVQREPCDHEGIGRPGCVTCDPRIRDAIGAGSARLADTPRSEG